MHEKWMIIKSQKSANQKVENIISISNENEFIWIKQTIVIQRVALT